MPLNTAVLDAQACQRIDAYWRAVNYLSVGQIYIEQYGEDQPGIRHWQWSSPSQETQA